MKSKEKEKITNGFPDVISFDRNKVRFALRKDRITKVTILIVEKKTTKSEMHRILRLANWLPSQFSLKVRKATFQVCVPQIISWDEKSSTLRLEYHEGSPLEYLLKKYTRGKERNFWIELIEKFFAWCNKRGFLWNDCAPRNMIVNTSLSRLTLVDFERGLFFRDKPISYKEFQWKAQDLIFEEFAAFLFPKEQRRVFNDIWLTHQQEFIDKESIISKRKRLLLEKRFGRLPQKVPISYVCKIGKLMADVATPFSYQGKIFFPMELLEKITQKGGTNEYVKTVLRIEHEVFSKRISILKEIAERLEC